MEVLFLTTLFSVAFAIFFLTLFLRTRGNRGACADQDALLPLLGNDFVASDPATFEPEPASLSIPATHEE